MRCTYVHVLGDESQGLILYIWSQNCQSVLNLLEKLWRLCFRLFFSMQIWFSLVHFLIIKTLPKHCILWCLISLLRTNFVLYYWRWINIIEFYFKRIRGRPVEQQMHKPGACCDWNISRNYVIMDQISRHVDKCDVLRNSPHSIVRESLVSQT